MTIALPFDNSYARLPDRFRAFVRPTPVSAPRLIRLNRPLAEDLGLDPEALSSPDGVAALAGNGVPGGSDPLAMAYAGHQFGQFVPQLGDGRAILLGEVVDRTGRRRDVQLKGAGPTPFSRRGDGRAALGPVLREYVVSEAMAVLGVPTTRALAAVSTGDEVVRETFLPGAVLTRVAASHIRVGTFQFFAVRRDRESLKTLADYAITRHDPAAAEADEPYRAFLAGVCLRQAELIAKWLLLGFIHGVMNTDNMSISGETIDYGPCAFMDAYSPTKVFSSIDEMGRYAYANQPRIGQWNLARLAETLLPLLSDDEDQGVKIAEEALGAYADRFEAAFIGGMRRKLGLLNDETDDPALARELLDLMAKVGADFTLTFRSLNAAVAGPEGEAGLRGLIADPALDDWLGRWRARLSRGDADATFRAEAMRTANPRLIPRNHRVEEAIRAAVAGDDAPFHALVDALADPFGDDPATAAYALPPEAHEEVRRTFCGT